MKRAVKLGCALTAAMAATLVGATAANAQESNSGSGMTIFGYAFSGSLSAEIAPNYIGSNKYSVQPTGSVQFYRPGTIPTFGAPDDSPSFEVLGDHGLSAGLVVGIRSGRDDDNPLQGFHK